MRDPEIPSMPLGAPPEQASQQQQTADPEQPFPDLSAWRDMPSRFSTEQWLWLDCAAQLLYHQRRANQTCSETSRHYQWGGFNACLGLLRTLEQEFPGARAGAIEVLNQYAQLIPGGYPDQRTAAEDVEVAAEFRAVWQAQALFEQIKNGKFPAPHFDSDAPTAPGAAHDVANVHDRSVAGAPPGTCSPFEKARS